MTLAAVDGTIGTAATARNLRPVGRSPCHLETCLVHPCRAEPRHALPLRPPRRAVAAGRAAAAGAALPHADPELLVACRTGRALHQLAAGPVCELPRAAGVSREDDRVQGHCRPGRGDGGLQPVRLLSRARGRELSVRLLRRVGARAGALPCQGCADAALQGLRRKHRARRGSNHRLPGRAEPAPAARHQVPDPHGAGRADPRSHADATARVRVATPAGCWCRRCATWGWRRASSPAT